MAEMERALTGADYFPTNPQAAKQYDELAACLGGVDAIKPQQQIMLLDIVRNELLKAELSADIMHRGLAVQESNGRQKYWRENKSVAMLMKLEDQQRRTMQALGLISKPKEQPDQQDDGDFDEF